MGAEPQQHQALLAVEGIPGRERLRAVHREELRRLGPHPNALLARLSQEE
jgi:hypothetical protein